MAEFQAPGPSLAHLSTNLRLEILRAKGHPHGMTFEQDGDGYLVGQLLIAMPQMTDPRFERTVI